MSWCKIAILSLFISLSNQLVYSQINVKGVVTDDEGGSLPGANVVIQGTNDGTVTDAGGNYSLLVPDENSVLIFSFIGYQSQEVALQGRQILNISLVADSKMLDDIVVVGYGTQKKVNVTGAVVSVDADKVANRGVTNVSNALAGQTPGVTILQRGGSPGRNEGTIRIRGIGTLGADAKNNPLIIVDGIETGSLVEVDPNDVANVSILKDAAASAIYGVRAANGVILITTKRGKAGAPTVQYNFQLGKSDATMLPEKADAFELVTLHNEANKNVGSPTLFKFSDVEKFKDGSSPLAHPNVNQADAVLSEPAVRQMHSVQLSGGSETAQYNISLGYTHEGGLMLNTGLDRYSVRANLDQQLSDRLTTGLNLSTSVREVTDPVDGVGGILHRAYREWATDIFQFPDGRWSYPTYSGLDHNAVAYIHDRGSQKTIDARLTGTLFLEYKVLKGLTIKGVAANIRDYNNSTSVQRSVELYTIDTNTAEISTAPNPSHPAVGSSIRKGIFNRSDLNLQLMLNYEKTIGRHEVKGLLGYNQRSERSETVGLSRRNLNLQLDQINGASSDPLDAATNGNTIDYRLRSGFGRINYAFKDRYLLEGNVRYDGTSRFPKQDRFKAFPSLSVGWRISEEPFLEHRLYLR